jgi:Zn-dependent peptidase ImmA (M78 family)
MRSAYYDQMRHLACEVRNQYSLIGTRITRTDMRRIYKDQGIELDLRDFKSKTLRGAYFNDDAGVSVMISKSLPEEPYIFTLGHELKHHLVDKDVRMCTDPGAEMIEIGAEVFAAELIFPQQLFIEEFEQRGVSRGGCTAEHLVRLKRSLGSSLSYAGLAKMAVRLGFAGKGTFDRTRWRQVEERLFGVPFYRRRAKTGA